MHGASVPLSIVRDAILAECAEGHELRVRLCEEYDRRLAALPLPTELARPGAALVAVGGLGRREVAPYSDLDLVLVSDGAAVSDAAAEQLWYPLWDSGLALDHATRTIDECLAVAGRDLPALLGMLWARPVAGDPQVAIDLRERIRGLWRAQARRRVAELAELCRRRWQVAGDGSSELEPDLKQSRGGLRDGQVLQALAVAHVADFRADMRRAHTLLLDLRAEVHRLARRRDDVLRRQFQQSIGETDFVAGGLDSADEVLRAVNRACRATAHELSGTLRRVAANAGRPPSGGSSSGRSASRLPLARDLVADAGEVVLARSARVDADPLLMLRAARVASEHALPIAPYLLRRFAERTEPPVAPWPAEARAEFVRLLGGPAVREVLEALDLAGLMTRILPAWAAVRGRAQHHPVHRHTVDRHLIETVSVAAHYRRDVARPDLLLVAALLHDIGKTGAGDHVAVGAPIAERAAVSMGFDTGDTALVTTLVRHHLLLVDTATGRDLDDPRTVTDVLAAIDGRLDTLDLLFALTRADARAVGSAAWTPWRATLVVELVRRVRDRARGVPPEPPPELPRRWRSMAETDGVAVLFDRSGEITVTAPDRRGVLNRTAGVLGLHSLQVRAATVRTYAGKAVNTYHVEPLFGELPDPAVLRGDLARTLADAGDLPARLERKERDYRQDSAARRPAVAAWLDHAASNATVVEVRADASIGTLYRITAVLERCGLDVQAARVRTWGNSVIAAFYVRWSGDALVPGDVRAAVDEGLSRVR
jgi:[protein-PII] uridylyltransferase